MKRKQRASVGFSPEQYDQLQKVAAEKKVSLGWVVREAVEQYLAKDAPRRKNAKRNHNQEW